jgi:hypothetical protein
MLEKKGPGIKISQPDSETIEVIEGGGAARVIGVIIFLGGVLLVWDSGGKIMGLSFIFGFLLVLFGAAVVTQRYVMILSKLHGTWSYGGDVFFIISFKSKGSLITLGSVRISKLATNPRESDMGNPIITYPVSIEARNTNGVTEELRFGQHWSIEEAKNIASILSKFLDKPVLDESNKNIT